MKKIETLVPDIYQVLDNGLPEPNKEFIEQMASNLAEVIYQQMVDFSKERKGKLRMSNVGRPCNRQLWYEANGEEGDKIDAQTKLKFIYGNVVEEVLLYLAKEAGHTVTHEQEEVELCGIKGHMDAVIDDVVVDVKSASSYAFKKFKEGSLADDDSFGYVPQISGYAKALNKDRAAFLAMDKNSGELALLQIDELSPIEDIINHTKEEVNGESLPPRGYSDVPDGKSGNRRLHNICNYCAFKRSCYPNLRAFKYSNGTKYLTEVSKMPNVLEVDL